MTEHCQGKYPSYSGGTVSYGTAAVVSTIADTPRELQLALKFLF